MLIAVLGAMVWRAPTDGPGGHPRADPRRRAGQSRPTGSSGATTGRWSTSSPCTSGPPSTWPTRAIVVGCVLLRGLAAARRRDRRERGLRSTVPASLDGVRVDKAVALLADLSRSSVDALIAEGRVTVDGRAVRSRSTALACGQELRDRPRRRCRLHGHRRRTPRSPSTWSTRTPTLIVVDKPAGLVVHPGPGTGPAPWSTGCSTGIPSWPRCPDAVGSRPRPPRHRAPAGPGHLGTDGGGPDPGRLPLAGGPAGRRAGVPDLPGPGARHGGRGVGRGRRPGRPVGQLAHPDGRVPPGQGGPDPLPRSRSGSPRRPRPP